MYFKNVDFINSQLMKLKISHSSFFMILLSRYTLLFLAVAPVLLSIITRHTQMENSTHKRA